MRRFFFLILSVGLVFLLQPKLVFAGSCKCTLTTQYGSAPNACYSNLINSASDCAGKLTDNNGQYTNCTFCSDNTCTPSNCQDFGLTPGIETCTTDTECQQAAGTVIGTKCLNNICYFSSTALESKKNQTGVLGIGQQVKISNPSLEIKIPGLNFSPINKTPDSEGYLHLTSLSEYIAAVYKFALGAASIVAAIMIVVNGFRISISAGGEQKNIGVKHITQAVIGLIILWSSYFLFYTINPEVVQYKVLKGRFILPIPYEEGGDSNLPLITGTTIEAALNCPKTGGTEAIPGIAAGMVGKVAYRFGGKGGPPPYQETNSRYLSYNDNCPSGNICLDCSGFINYVYYCAGLPTINGGTDAMFVNATKIVDGNLDVDKNTVNGVSLQAGDLLGWMATDAGHPGHVIMYIGDGKVAEAYGGIPGRQAGANPLIRKLKNIDLNTYNFTYIKKISP